MKLRFIAAACLTLLTLKGFSQDKRFYIFICFGQSNMEGNARIQAQDTIGVDSRFQVLQVVDCTDRARTKGNWYTAIPPLVRCKTGLTPADYFGRTLVANLPKKIRIGIINSKLVSYFFGRVHLLGRSPAFYCRGVQVVRNAIW